MVSRCKCEVKCALCGGKSAFYSKVEECKFFKCSSCGLVFSKDRRINVASLYGGNYFYLRGHSWNVSPAIVMAKSATFRYYLDKLEKVSVKKGRLLELGCSTGIFLKEARDFGWDIYGVEVSQEAANVAKDYLGEENKRNIFVGDIENIYFSEEYFACVALLDTLEHFSDPFSVIEKIYSLLVPGGIIFILTPDIASLSARLMKRGWPHLMKEHIFYFSTTTIRLLLEGKGFKIEELNRAKKFVTLGMLKRHIDCHKHIFMSNLLSAIFNILPKSFEKYIFPFNIGEMYIIARKECHS